MVLPLFEALSVPVAKNTAPLPLKFKVELAPCVQVDPATVPVIPLAPLALKVPLLVIVTAPLMAVVPDSVTMPPAVMVTGPLMVRLPVMVRLAVAEKEGAVAPLMVKVPVLVVEPVPPTIEDAPDTVTPPLPLCVPLLV